MCVYMHMLCVCMCVHVHACVHMCTCACRGLRLTLDVSVDHSSPYIWREDEQPPGADMINCFLPDLILFLKIHPPEIGKTGSVRKISYYEISTPQHLRESWTWPCGTPIPSFRDRRVGRRRSLHGQPRWDSQLHIQWEILLQSTRQKAIKENTWCPPLTFHDLPPTPWKHKITTNI